MNTVEIVQSLQHIRPGAIWTLFNGDLDWQDKNQTEPTEAEIKAGWIAYQAAQKAEAEAKAQAKAALLAQLGITEEQAKLLLS
jgi:hypothetical protein